jgi:hypothetical protein
MGRGAGCGAGRGAGGDLMPGEARDQPAITGSGARTGAAALTDAASVCSAGATMRTNLDDVV